MKIIIKVILSVLIVVSFTSCERQINGDIITPLDDYEFKFFVFDENGENIVNDSEETLHDVNIYLQNKIYKYGDEYDDYNTMFGPEPLHLTLSDDLEGAFIFAPVYVRHGARLLVNYGENQWEVLINVSWHNGEYKLYDIDFVVDDEPAEMYLDTDAVVLRM